ncbi:hypothetical protein BH23PAT1_BH23PAT1_1110 [soil metagenome]
MIGAVFEALIIRPIFNLLVFIYALIPGHNFGLSIIVFTIVIRLLLWPLVKKQLHHTKQMRKLQPELKRIKQAAKGNRQKESAMVMELYKEREINPFAAFPTLILQLIILLGLYQGLIRVIANPQAIIDFAYGWIGNFGWMQTLAADIDRFDATLFGVVDLSRSALGSGGVYWPAMFLVVGSAVSQYFQSKQLMPQDKDARSLRRILKDAGSGKQADQSEVNAAVGRSTQYFIPIMIFVFTVGLASALALYWFVGGLVAYIQQGRVLRQDEEELEAIADNAVKPKGPAKASNKEIIEGEIVEKPKTNTASSKKKKSSKKRRKR